MRTDPGADLVDMDCSVPGGETLARSAETADRIRPASGAFAKRGRAAEPLGITAHGQNGLPVQRRTRLAVRRAAILLGVGGFGLLLYGSVARFTTNDAAEASRSAAAQPTSYGVRAIELPPPNLLRPLTPEQAAEENAERPFVSRPDTAAGKFVLRTDAEDRGRAIACLTQAIYYEAAGEGDDGGRAVAQVVLNRMRHPGYPSSVCGVVYQGAERLSGCQFTFTCDGSLQRVPIAALWTRSRKIAEDALAGRVFAPIGHATHYHADYVLPYWADSLDKTVQIARHIFYRLRGSLGDGRSFFQHYAGAEPVLPVAGEAVVLPPSTAEQLASALMSDNVNGTAQEVERVAQAASPLVIDSSRGTLIADEAGTAAPPRKPRSSNDCGLAGDRKQLAPLGANDMHSAATPSSC